MAEPQPDLSRVYQLKITLLGSQPAVWRQLEVQNTTLDQLSQFILVAMGWHGSHLHQFHIKGIYYGEQNPDYDDLGLFELKDESRFFLSDVLPGKVKSFVYLYDMGDGWEHQVTVEQVAPPLAGRRYPVCTGGAGACPPEDVGGIPGYYHFLEAIGNPSHPERAELLEWVGGSFDPDRFDLAGTNELLTEVAVHGPWWDWAGEPSETAALSLTELRNNLADIVENVAYRGERYIVTRHGEEVAALVDIDDLRALEEMESFFAFVESKGGMDAIRERMEKEGQ